MATLQLLNSHMWPVATVPGQYRTFPSLQIVLWDSIVLYLARDTCVKTHGMVKLGLVDFICKIYL